MEVSMCNKKFLTAVIALALICAPVFAQVESVDEIEAPPPQFQDHGGVTPWFWIGLQTVFSGGYNFETTAGGFRNYGGPDHTYASFNLAFVDSHYQTPKFYEVPRQLDPDAWTGHFILINFTSRLNSWSGDTRIENNVPAWLAEITGKGARIGFFTQAGNIVGGLSDGTRTAAANTDPIMRISGGNKVLNLGSGQLGKLYYEKPSYSTSDPSTKATTTYTTSDGAIMYAGYEQKELWNVYLTLLSEGNVNSDVTNNAGEDVKKGFAGVIDFGATPFGLITDEEAPLTFNVTGNAIAGFKFTEGVNSQQSAGFGLKGGSGIWLGQSNLVLSPVVAFDGKIDVNNDFFWKFGGGLIFQFSGMRWANDDWGDMYNTGGTGSTSESALADYRYENNKVLKYAYAQAYAAYSEENDLNILFRVEEPDGNLGFHEKLGFMAEVRLYNLTEKDEKKPTSWASQARVSWDFNIQQFFITPYARAYLDSNQVVKMRLGAYANFIPFTGFEIAYTSANLNPNADTTAKPMSHYDGIKDAGRIELVVILKSDDIQPQVPKRMSDWNYPNVINKY
jgi:hypothetical protein